MAYSIQQFTSTGTEDHAILSFPYLDKADIHLYGNSVESTFVWASGTRIDFPPFPAGTEVVVRRLTQRDRVRYLLQEGAPFTREVLDQIHTQVLYLSQESIEGAWFDLYGDVDMHGFHVRNAGDPELPQDYTTKLWVETQILSAQLGDGALAQALQEQVREALRRSYAEVGYNQVAGSFEAGGTVTSPTDVLLYEATGVAYSWGGVLPKTVPSGSTPTTTGGVGVGAWIEQSKSRNKYENIEAMLADTSLVVGRKVNTGLTDWRITSSSGWAMSNGLFATPLNGLWVQDSSGFDGAGINGMSATIQNVISNIERVTIMLGDNDIRIDATITYKGGTRIRGSGRRGDYKYASSGTVGGTLLIVDDGVAAFRVTTQWAHYPEISSMTFRAKTNGSSSYGNVAKFSAGTHGIDVLYTVDGKFEDLAFESMDFGVYNRLGSGQQALRPAIKSIVAQDCNYVLRFINGAADVHLSDVPVALHCNYMIFCDTVDGIHLSDIRLFQSYNTSITFKNTQFVNGSNIVCFETANTQMVVDNCDNVDISALTLSRAGWYHVGTPFPKKLALNVVNSRNVKLQGSIERPSGAAINVDATTSATIDMDVNLPFNTNGGTSAVTVFSSKLIELRGTYRVRGNATHAVELDDASRYEVQLNVTADAFFKKGRYINTNAQRVNVIIPEGIVVGSGGTSTAVFQQVLNVPAGKLLALAHIRYNNRDGLRPRIGSNFFLTMAATDEGKEDWNLYTLLDNTNGVSTVKYTLVLQLYNNSGVAITSGLSDIELWTKLV